MLPVAIAFRLQIITDVVSVRIVVGVVVIAFRRVIVQQIACYLARAWQLTMVFLSQTAMQRVLSAV